MKYKFLFLLAIASLYSCNKYVPLSTSVMKENNVSWQDLTYNQRTNKGLEGKLSGKIVLGITDSASGKVYRGRIIKPSKFASDVTFKKGKFGVITEVDSIKRQALVSYGTPDQSLTFGADSTSGVFFLANSNQDSTSNEFLVEYETGEVKPLREGQKVQYLVRLDKPKKPKKMSPPPGRRWGE